jgi:hypothetical protein
MLMATGYCQDRLTKTLFIITFVGLVYLATLTADYYWDGITFALQIEKVAKMERGASLLFHQNHLLYSGIGYVVYSIARALSSTVRSLYVLQIMNVFAGAVAVGIFFHMTERLTRSRHAALISSAVLALSAVWWKLATDANAYMVSLLLMLICADTLFSARPRWLLAASALGGAMLIHQLASLFYPAALVAVLTSTSLKQRWKFAGKLSALAWGATIGAYYLCASLLHEINNPLEVVKWAVSNQSGVSPSGNPLPGLLLLPRGNLDMIIGHNFALYRNQSGSIEKLFAWTALFSAIICLAVFLRRARWIAFLKGSHIVAPRIRQSWKACAPALITWIVVYVVFLLFWEPWQVLYRVFYLPPLALALGFVLTNYHTRGSLPTDAAALGVATLALFNLAFFICPNMRTTANPRVAAARSAQHIWNDKTVVYFANRNEADTAFEYFNVQTRWRRFNAAAKSGIDEEIRRAFDQSGQIWLNKGAAEAVDAEWLAARAHGREITLELPDAPARYVELLANQ